MNVGDHLSIADQLGIEGDSELLDQARRQWPEWARADTRLAVVEEYDDLREWLRTAEPAPADEVLLALAELAAPDGGDDIAAAGALAKQLMPGAVVIARQLRSVVLRTDLDRRSGSCRVDDLVASELWLQVRSFPWQRAHKAAANILMNTRAGVLYELGGVVETKRRSRVWADTQVLGELDETVVEARDQIGAPALLQPGEEPEVTALEELLEVLAWACKREVISTEDRHLLLCLVEEASRTAGRTGANGGLTANEISIKVAPRLGLSAPTVRRRAGRSIKALAQAVPGGFAA